MKWLSLVTYAVEKLPIERMFVKKPDPSKHVRELAEILGKSKTSPAVQVVEDVKPAVEVPASAPHPKEDIPSIVRAPPKVHLEDNPAVTSGVSTRETVDYQNREIGKTLLKLERHLAQKFRIAGRACDCGQTKHLLELEALAEETVPMVDNPDIYHKILDWISRLGPQATIENVTSGKYDDQYQVFANEARDLRKELLGTLDAKILFPSKAEAISQEVN